MIRGIVLDADAANRLSLGSLEEDWLVTFDCSPGISRHDLNGLVFLVGSVASADSRLLVIKSEEGQLFTTLPLSARLECFQRILRSALSEFRPGFVKIPLEWRVFHSGSLISFQTNRQQTGITARAYIEVAPEGTNHVYAYYISHESGEPLSRRAYDADLFIEAVLSYDEAARRARSTRTNKDLGHLTVSLNETFGNSNITLGLPFSVWRDRTLTRKQLDFFNAPFNGPLRVRGPAGSGKTLVLAMRFLKEIYERLDRDEPNIRGCFLAHGEETAEHVVRYLVQMDERGIILDPKLFPNLELEITTLHGLANRFINTDTDNIQPLSLDGSEGRTLQFEVIESIVDAFVHLDWKDFKQGCKADFAQAIESKKGEPSRLSFCVDLSDEFANVLEALGVRALDDISVRYLRVRASERGLAQNVPEKAVVLELYRRFRKELTDMNVVSLDQFTSDFLAYLNSFRWEALRREKGFDFVFADEMHLFNSQERRTLGYLLRESEPPRRVAIAYDPRQSPRNSFFPQSSTARDTVWSEAGLDSPIKPFELTDVFRYTPQILAFLNRLNEAFPATDLAEEWSLNFGQSLAKPGPIPTTKQFSSQKEMADFVAARSNRLARSASKGEHVAVLCLDHDRFAQYRQAGIFSGHIVVGGRDELGSIGKFRHRAVLSMPEYVAGLQFKSVLLLDANSNLIGEMGGGISGLHRFISSVYLGASRAKTTLEIYSDAGAGGFAEPIKDAVQRKLLIAQ